MKDIKSCFGPHQNTHTAFGIGIGLVLAGVFSASIGQNALTLGIIITVAALAYDYFMVKDK